MPPVTPSLQSLVPGHCLSKSFSGLAHWVRSPKTRQPPPRTLGAVSEDTTTPSSHISDTAPGRLSASAYVTFPRDKGRSEDTPTLIKRKARVGYPQDGARAARPTRP